MRIAEILLDLAQALDENKEVERLYTTRDASGDRKAYEKFLDEQAVNYDNIDRHFSWLIAEIKGGRDDNRPNAT